MQDSVESMPKKCGITRPAREVAEFLRLGGRKIPAKLAAKSRAAVKAAVKSMLLQKRNAEIEPRIQGAKLKGWVFDFSGRPGEPGDASGEFAPA